MLYWELMWDERSDEHIARHNVTMREVEEALMDERSRESVTQRDGEDRIVVLGRTDAGRYLAVILDPLGGGYVRCITEFDMSANLRSQYVG